MNNSSNLMKKLMLLIGVFIFGISAIMLLDNMFLKLEKELDNETLNLKSKVKLSEFIIEDLHQIKADFYELAVIDKKQARDIVIEKLYERIKNIKSYLNALDRGGILQKIVKLNILKHLNDVKYVKFLNENKNNISLERIDIYPKLNQIIDMTKELNNLLDKKNEYEAESDVEKMKNIEKDIIKFYKSSPAFFTKIMENTKQLLFESENELKDIQTKIEEKKKHYAHIELIIIIITVLLIMIVGYKIARQIDKNNKKLNNLNQKLSQKVFELQKHEIFTRGVLDAQSNIVIVNDNKKILMCNLALFEFFEEYHSLEEFQNEHKCICELFVIPDDVTNTKIYITNKDYDGNNWVEHILLTPNFPHKAAMYKNKKLYHFNIYVQKMIISELEFILIVSLNDITYEISHQKRLKVLNKSLKESIKDVKNLLNNANQGFLSFSKDFLVKKQYSKICLKFFKTDIYTKDISYLLYPDDKKKREFFIRTLKEINFQDIKIKNEAILSLLDKELRLNGKIVQIEYKMLSNETYMLILTDITEKRILEKKINKEKKVLKMVIEIVSLKYEFLEILQEYKKFIKDIKSFIKEDKTPIDNESVLYRRIHTFKGLFLQKELIYTTNFLHQIETKLSNVVTENNFTNEYLLNFLDNTDFLKPLNDDLSIIEEILGSDFIANGARLKIRKENIEKIEKKMEILIKNEKDNRYLEILEDIKNLKNKPLIELFNSYPKLLNQLSEKLNKSIYPLDIVIDKNLYINKNIKPFVNSLIHIYRNAIDHGIEKPDIRCAKQKDEIGTINTNIYQEKNRLHIIISDDGAGIDIDKIKQKANKLNINTENFTQKEMLNLIFYDKLSSKDEISDISGRGVGLSATKEQLELLGGEVEIKTKKDEGTTFHFIIPI